MEMTITTTFKIEKDVPVPPRTSGGRQSGTRKALADRMTPGDSVYFEEIAQAKKLCNALYLAKKPSSRRKEGRGMRVWCTHEPVRSKRLLNGHAEAHS